MKRLISLLSILCALFTSSYAKDPQGHSLDKLWDSYYEAQKADKPKEQLAILANIKQEARTKKLAWDFYDAADKYVDVWSRSNWKLRETLQKQMNEEVAEFPSPVLGVYHSRSINWKDEKLLQFVKDNKQALLSSYNPEFYSHDRRIGRLPYGSVLQGLLDSDYDYALWCLFSANPRNKSLTPLLGARFDGRYPFDGLLEYTRILNNSDLNKVIAGLTEFSERYPSRAVGAFAREGLLNYRLGELNRKHSSSEEYISISNDIQSVLTELKGYRTFPDNSLAECCNVPQMLLEELRSHSIDIWGQTSTLSISLRNIESVQLQLKDQGGNTIIDETLDNPKRSFYALDTLKYTISNLDDGRYSVSCKSGKLTKEASYEQYRLSLAVKRDSLGYGIFVADYMSGEPVDTCKIELRDKDGAVIACVDKLPMDGFTRLPEEFNTKILSATYRTALRASCLDSLSHKLLSRDQALYNPKRNIQPINRSHCIILSDRSAYNLGEKVSFKAMLYSEEEAEREVIKGEELEVILLGPKSKLLSTKKLITNEFGSIYSDFTLPKDEQGGEYIIAVKRHGVTIESHYISVDEFALPSFDLEWTLKDEFYLPGDLVTIKGNIRSYSGHPLSGADVSFEIRRGAEAIKDGKVELDANGDFAINFNSRDKYDYAYYDVCVKVIDATGETLEFSRWARVDKQLPFEFEPLNFAKGEFFTYDLSDYHPNDWDVMGILSEDSFKFTLGPKNSERKVVNFSYDLYKGDDVDENILASGSLKAGENSISFSDLNSGQYYIHITVQSTSDLGVQYTNIIYTNIIYAPDDALSLSDVYDYFVKELPSDDFSLQVGVFEEPLWIVTELYSNGNKLIASKVVEVEAAADSVDCKVAKVGFEAADSLAGDITLKLLFFKNGEAHTYSKIYSKPSPKRAELPLEFTRMLNTTRPNSGYSLEFHTSTSTECAVTIFDASSENVAENQWRGIGVLRTMPSEEVDYLTLCGEISIGRRYGRNIIRGYAAAKASNSVEEYKESDGIVEMYLDDVLEEDQIPLTEAPISPKVYEEGEEYIPIRDKFNLTLAWEPCLKPDTEGNVRFDFHTSGKLSTYYVQVYAHDKGMNTATLREKMLVTLPVKISIAEPSVLRVGDKYTTRVDIVSSHGDNISGKVNVSYYSSSDYIRTKPFASLSQPLQIKSNSHAEFANTLTVPDCTELGILLKFTPDDAGQASDAVFVVVPVDTGEQVITETHSALLRSADDKEDLVARLRSEFRNSTGEEAEVKEISILEMLRKAIPEKLDVGTPNLVGLLEALYADYLMGNPILGSSTRLGEKQKQEICEKILACHNADGGFGWLPGMKSSPIMTAHLLQTCALMQDGLPEALSEKLEGAVLYTDKTYFGPEEKLYWRGCLSLEQYLWVRALYPEIPFDSKALSSKELKDFQKDAKAYLAPGETRGLNGQILPKARRALTLKALLGSAEGLSLANTFGINTKSREKLEESLRKDIESLEQYAQPHSSGGSYFPNAVLPWRGLLENELYAHTLLCNLFAGQGRTELADELRLWIMVQKETQNWGDDPTYIEALATVLSGGESLLQTKVITLCDETHHPFEEVKSAGNGFTIHRTFLRDGNPLREGDVLRVGEKIIARYEVSSDENRSFVRLVAPRPGSLRPVDQLSGNIYYLGGYRSVLSDRTEFWFDSYPEEKTSLEEEFYVSAEGVFSVPTVSIESLYAPHYRANDAGGKGWISEK